jgi:hypothetical protein
MDTKIMAEWDFIQAGEFVDDQHEAFKGKRAYRSGGCKKRVLMSVAAHNL